MTNGDEGWTEDTVREAIASARRIVVKIGSSSLASVNGGLDEAKIENLVAVLADAHDSGRDVLLVSSGAIATGLKPLKLSKRPTDLAHQQAAAAVGQGVMMQHYTQLFAARGIVTAQVLLTVEDLTRQESYSNALRTLGTLIRMGVVPIINENDTVATHELRFGDNDRIAALIAQLARADALILLTDVPGLYTAHPDEPGSKPISFVPDIEGLSVDTTRIGSKIGTGGMQTKLLAAQIACSAGIPVVLTQANQAKAAINGSRVGTCLAPIDKRRPRRLLWLAYASSSCGKLTLDEGALDAVLNKNASLLPAGISKIEGDFRAGDPVDLVNARGESVARGLVSYDHQDLAKMVGKHTVDIVQSMGEQYDRAAVHRDVLIVLHSGTNSIGDQ